MAAIAPAEGLPPLAGIHGHLNDHLSSTAKRAAAVEAPGQQPSRPASAGRQLQQQSRRQRVRRLPAGRHAHLNGYPLSTVK